jgi:hypothetical protein
VGRTSQHGAYAGAWQASLGGRVPQLYNSSMRVTKPSRFFVLGADVFAQLMNEWFPMAVHLLDGGFFYRTNLEELTGQRERLLALGSLSAGWPGTTIFMPNEPSSPPRPPRQPRRARRWACSPRCQTMTASRAVMQVM